MDIIITILIIAMLALCCGFMGAWTGAGGSKLWRRFGIPFLYTLAAFLSIANWWVLTILLMFGVLSLGYGIPTPPSDNGSPLGRFWYDLVHGDEKLATALTRTTLGILMLITLLSVPILTSAWGIFSIFVGVFIFNQILWTTLLTGLGMFSFMGKSLNVEEFCLYTTDAILVLTMIHLA